MKKLLAVCFVFVLVCTLLCGCGGPAVDLGDGPSVSREEAVVISEKDGEITGRLDLDRYSFAQLSEAEKEENVLSFDGDVILFEGSYRGNVTLEGNGHKKKCSAEFHTNNSAPIRFTLTADYGSQDRYVVFVGGGHGSVTESSEASTVPRCLLFDGIDYPAYSSLEEAETYAVPLVVGDLLYIEYTDFSFKKARVTIRYNDTEFAAILTSSNPVNTISHLERWRGQRLLFTVRYITKDGDYLYAYYAFDVQ